MKYRITESDFSKLSDIFAKSSKNHLEIDLEPVDQTASEAIYRSAITDDAFHRGYHFGWKNGYYQSKMMRDTLGNCCKETKCPYL